MFYGWSTKKMALSHSPIRVQWLYTGWSKEKLSGILQFDGDRKWQLLSLPK